MNKKDIDKIVVNKLPNNSKNIDNNESTKKFDNLYNLSLEMIENKKKVQDQYANSKPEDYYEEVIVNKKNIDKVLSSDQIKKTNKEINKENINIDEEEVNEEDINEEEVNEEDINEEDINEEDINEEDINEGKDINEGEDINEEEEIINEDKVDENDINEDEDNLEEEDIVENKKEKDLKENVKDIDEKIDDKKDEEYIKIKKLKVLDPNAPSKSELDKKERENLRYKFEILKQKYKNVEIPYISDNTDVEKLKVLYERVEKLANVNISLESYRFYLIVGFMVFEYILSLTPLPIKGFYNTQLSIMHLYNPYLIEMSEKGTKSIFSRLPVEVRLFGFVLFNVVVFVIMKYTSKGKGGNEITSFIQGITGVNISNDNNENNNKQKRVRMKGPNIKANDIPEFQNKEE